MISFHQMEHICSNSHYFHTEFMTKYPWIRQEWLIAMKGMIVSSTDAYLSDANKCLGRSRHRWISKSNHPYFSRSIKTKCTHLRSFLWELDRAVQWVARPSQQAWFKTKDPHRPSADAWLLV